MFFHRRIIHGPHTAARKALRGDSRGRALAWHRRGAAPQPVRQLLSPLRRAHRLLEHPRAGIDRVGNANC